MREGPTHGHSGALRLVLRTQPRSGDDPHVGGYEHKLFAVTHRNLRLVSRELD
jgi:hypothetical protein